MALGRTVAGRVNLFLFPLPFCFCKHIVFAILNGKPPLALTVKIFNLNTIGTTAYCFVNIVATPTFINNLTSISPVVFDVRTRSNAVSVYPTALKTNDALNISILDTNFHTEATVEIYSMLGIMVYSTKLTAPMATIRPDFRQKGNYFVRIKLPTGEIFNAKIVVQ